jgi:hypothetical protein
MIQIKLFEKFEAQLNKKYTLKRINQVNSIIEKTRPEREYQLKVKYIDSSIEKDFAYFNETRHKRMIEALRNNEKLKIQNVSGASVDFDKEADSDFLEACDVDKLRDIHRKIERN